MEVIVKVLAMHRKHFILIKMYVYPGKWHYSKKNSIGALQWKTNNTGRFIASQGAKNFIIHKKWSQSKVKNLLDMNSSCINPFEGPAQQKPHNVSILS